MCDPATVGAASASGQISLARHPIAGTTSKEMCLNQGKGMQSKSLFERQVENRMQHAENPLTFLQTLTAPTGPIEITVRATFCILRELSLQVVKSLAIRKRRYACSRRSQIGSVLSRDHGTLARA